MPTISPQVTPYYGGGQVVSPADTLQTSGAPSTANINHNLGTLAIDNAAGNIYGLASKSGGVASWVLLGGSSGAVSSVLGTANQITVTTVGNVATASLPVAITAPGSLATTTTLASGTTLTAGSSLSVTTSAVIGTTLTATGGLTTLAALTQVGTTSINASGAAVTTIGTGGTGAVNIGNTTGNTAVTGSLTASTSLTATLGNITATNGNIVLTAAGNKMVRTSVASTTAAGANSIGSVTLVGGTATISTTSVTASSLIQVWRQSIGATGAAALGIITVGTISAGVSFVINAVQSADATALQASDVSVIGWEIIN